MNKSSFKKTLNYVRFYHAFIIPLAKMNFQAVRNQTKTK